MSEAVAEISVDLLIVGGGVAGLWLLNRAVKAGHHALLVEKHALGGGQSVHAQGIVHGGMKYALTGTFTRAAASIAAMPDRWRQCLAGSGEIDLSAVKALSPATFLWSQGSLGSKMTSFLAAKALRGRVDPAAVPDRPPVLRDASFSGSIYRLAEPVLDMPSVVATLAAPLRDRIVKADIAGFAVEADGSVKVSLAGAPQPTLRATRVVLAAGAGNAELCSLAGLDGPAMQRRPLHMVAVEHDDAPQLFGHAIGTGPVPLLSITTHPGRDGRYVWYLGGGIAETGVERSEGAQVDAARALIAQVLPWVTLRNPHWSTLRIDRAEPATSAGARPDTGFAEERGPFIVAWPTKMTLSPDLVDRVLAMLPAPSSPLTDLSALSALPRPKLARPFWEAST